MLDLTPAKKAKQNLTTQKTAPPEKNPLLQQLKKRFSSHSDVSMRSLLEAKAHAEASVKVAWQNEALFRKAHFDALTHLPNRAYFDEVLEHFIVSSHDQEMAFALLFLDLDGFKAINDQMGHRAGDELLRHVAARLIFSVREEDKVFRLGGDEFVVLLPEVSEPDLIETVAQRIIREVSQDYWIAGHPVHISTSIGIALFPKDGQIASKLIEHADQALYAAKAKGKGEALFYDESYLHPQQKFAAEVADLERAIEAAELVSSQCEQYSLERQALEMIHLSVCWQQQPLPHWEQKLEASRYASQVGFWLIDNGFYQLHQNSEMPQIQVAVPLVPKLLKQPHLEEKLSNALTQHQVKAEQVLLQVSANCWDEVMQPANGPQAQIERLTQKGFHFLLDGVDENNFVLKNMQHPAIQVVQLNAGWVLQEKQTGKLETVKTLVQMLHLLGKKVSLEEGVLEPKLMQSLEIDWVKSFKF